MIPASESHTANAPSATARSGFFLSGTLTNDLTIAALGAMAGSAVSYLFLLVKLGFAGAVFVYGCKIVMYWGLLQVGRLYQLTWVRRGASLLLLTKLIGLLPFVITGFTASVATWLTGILEAIGIMITFIDIWGLRRTVNQPLVTAVVVGFVAELFIGAMELLPQPVFYLVKSANVGLLAWLFYEIITQNSPSRSSR
ncbi:hypothetical protein [Fibrella forsythiae]|uniref:Uncharacterized protein n=1 Tax=Fibrella forsythiae TaxID=2817061 RepID=A0ABS3JHY6_9BACT|nr:hypothetical protein [Fibrella forsythiae]MBO0949624.1 hypothetical protein [Fibrella forsythiae]